MKKNVPAFLPMTILAGAGKTRVCLGNLLSAGVK